MAFIFVGFATAGVVGAIAGGAVLAGGVYAYKQGVFDPPELPQAPALPDFSSTTGAQFAARQNAAGAGRQGTILTGKSGLLDEAPVKKKTLLGQ